jgi:hypothetical protein
MYPSSPLDPNHEQKRSTLSGVGLLLMVIGVPCAVGGALSFLSVFLTPTSQFFADPGGTMDSNARHAIFGMVFIFIGVTMSGAGARMVRFANVGKIMRYSAGEVVPLARDIVSDVSPLIDEVGREFAGAVRDGFRGESATDRVHSCGAMNHPGDAFCKGCGQPLLSPRCPKCNSTNDPDARFCHKCGHQLRDAFTTA